MVDTPGLPGRETGTVVVTFPGEIDLANADGVGAELTAAFGPGTGIVIADLSGTRFCDTSGIHALVMAYKKAQATNTGFRVVVPPGEVRHVLDILHLDTVLALYPRLDLALPGGGRDPQPGWERLGGGGVGWLARGPFRRLTGACSRARRLPVRAVPSRHG